MALATESTSVMHTASAAVAELIKAERIAKIYKAGDTEVEALRGVDLTLYEGELVVLLGPSGSGKSTLLNILGGLDRPSRGKLYFRGEDITDISSRDLTLFRRHNIGFVFQFYNLIPSLTALENVSLVTEIAPAAMSPAEALNRVGLSARPGHFPAQLSGGEQQRVAVARAIAKRPNVLLCDEPTDALDSKTGVLVLRALAEANRELNATTVVITHNVVIAQMVDRIVRFADGVIAAIETKQGRVAPATLTW